jgi:hypothetical protein
VRKFADPLKCVSECVKGSSLIMKFNYCLCCRSNEIMNLNFRLHDDDDDDDPQPLTLPSSSVVVLLCVIKPYLDVSWVIDD